MNNTKTLAIVAILMAATLVVGGTLAATTPSAAFAYANKKKGDEGNSKNGNTITIQKCKQLASESGFDNTEEQECQNVICTHPGDNATCSQEGAVSAAAALTTGTLLVKKICRNFVGTPCAFTIMVTGNNPQPSTFVLQNGDNQLVTLGPGSYTVKETQPPGIISSFAGDCTEIAINGTATGAISAGQHQTCTITNMPE
jgi:hypothetical protein